MLSWDGGHRVPCIARWPGKIPAGIVSNEIITSMDLYPTFTKLAGGTPDTTVQRDGLDITRVLLDPGKAQLEDRIYYFYVYTNLQAVRQGRWKLVLPRPEYPEWTGFCGRFYGDNVDETELYDLEEDPSESANLASSHPDIVSRMMKLVEKGRSELGDYDRIGSGARFFANMPRRPDVEKWQDPEK